MKSIFLSLLFTIDAMAFVRQSSVSLEEIPRTERFAGVSEKELAKKAKTFKDPLTKAAYFQFKEDWLGCVEQVLLVPSKSIVYDQALLLGLSCADELISSDSKSPTKSGPNSPGTLTARVLEKGAAYIMRADPDNRDRVVWAMRGTRLKLAQWLKNKSQWKDLDKQVQILMKDEMYYSKEDRGLIYLLAGEYLVAERKWENVYWQFERARTLSPDSQIESRVKAVLPMLPSKFRNRIETLTRTPPEQPVPSPNLSVEEQEIYNQAQSYLSRRESGAISALAKLIRKFPGGLKAKWAQDRLFELFNIELEKSKSGGEGPTVGKKKILNEMMDFDPERQVEWARILFSSQNYAEAAQLYNRAADQAAASFNASKYFYLAGRAYQLSGNFPEAQRMFATVTKNYPAAPEFVDAAIQWALINLNSNEASDAIAHLEMARTRKMSTQQDLISLFWLYQAYKARNTQEGIARTSQEILARFPLSYYGLIVFNEVNGHLPQINGAGSKTGKVYFSEGEKKSLARAKALLNSGLLQAASDELNFISTRPLSLDESQYLANFYAQTFAYPKAFNLISSVIEEARDRQNLFVMKALFPKEYWDFVKEDKAKSGLDPFLILSIIKQESAFGHKATSKSNAMGLMQLIPPTAEEVKRQLSFKGEVPKVLFDPATNILFGSTYFANLLKRFGNSVPQALASYNAGPTRVNQFVFTQNGSLRDTWVDELPWAETSHYVKAILRNYVWYRILYGDMQQLPSPPWASPPKEQQKEHSAKDQSSNAARK